MTLKNLAIPFISAALMAAFTSCNSTSSDNGTEILPIYRTIVTVASATSTGTTFTACEKDDMPEIVYTTTQTLNTDKVKAGMRMGIEYQVEADAKQWQSGVIRLTGISGCYGDGKEMPISKADDTNNWRTERISDAAIWRTGKYLNAMILAYGTISPLKCNFTVDEATLTSDTPEVHLIYEADYASVNNGYIFFLSYDLSALKTNQGATNATGVKVFYDYQGSTKTVDIAMPSNL